MIKLSENLKNLRFQKKLKQIDVAKGAGITRATYSRLEVGTVKNPMIHHLIALADFYDISLDKLIRGYEMPEWESTFVLEILGAMIISFSEILPNLIIKELKKHLGINKNHPPF